MRTTLPALMMAAGMAFASPAFAQYPPPPMPQPNTPTISYEWTGSNLRYTPSSTQGCRIDLLRVFVRSGTIFASVRNSGTDTRSLTLSATLTGTNQNKTGGGTGRLNAGQTGEVQLMTPFGGSMNGTTMAVRATGCVAS